MKKKRLLAILLSLFLLVGVVTAVSAMAAKVPAPTQLKYNVQVEKNAKATLDYSNLSEGILFLTYTGGNPVKIKVQIAKSGGTTYTYSLNNTGFSESFPLVEGNGAYTIRVFENTTGTKYATVFSYTLNLKLRDATLPFLYSNQYVAYNPNSAAVVKANELCAGQKSELDKVHVIYDFVVGTLTYDKQRAATVQSGYLPNLDQVMQSKKGICFDYASLMTAMLRSQNVPCKLIIGYAGTAYHAWINVYTAEQGWIEAVVYFDGQNWSRMDPTFASSSHSNPEIMKYIGNGSNYTQKYAY
ncbi:MAG: transglutaminase-like domain-containing protein [Evtepia sp.]